jgi:hypothetical protein
LKLEEPINEKSELVLPVKHIGEWLFFNQNDIDLSLDEISKIDVYVKYGNQKIVSYLARSDLQEQWTKKNSKYVETQPSKFIVYKNSFLTKNVIAYFNRPYTGFKNYRNPDFLNTLKNTFDREDLMALNAARKEVESILLADLQSIMRQHNFLNCICVCVPRAKALDSYTHRQLFFREAVKNASNKISGLVDGTDVIVRHTNTFTTHLGKATEEGRLLVDNDGERPYPGITKKTCHIEKEKIVCQNVILVDDIYTNGVNIDEDCIQALLENGIKDVIFYAVGRSGVQP